LLPEAGTEEVVQTNIVAREESEKLLNCHRLGHGDPPSPSIIVNLITDVNGIIPCAQYSRAHTQRTKAVTMAKDAALSRGAEGSGISVEADCKSVHPGSIPGVASSFPLKNLDNACAEEAEHATNAERAGTKSGTPKLMKFDPRSSHERKIQLMRSARGRVVTIDGVDYPLSFNIAQTLCGYGREPHQLYVMAAGVSMALRSKIGQSKDARERVADICMSSPFPVKLVRVWRAPRFAVGWLEKHAHDLLSDRHSHGEWFKCSEWEAIRAVKAALEHLPLLRDFYGYAVNQTPEWRAAVKAFRAEPFALPPAEMPIP